jgi:protein-disulfide isomerase
MHPDRHQISGQSLAPANSNEELPVSDPVLSSPRVLTSRRLFLLASGAAALAASAFPTGTIAQRKQGPAEVPVDELMKPGELPELVLGDPDAKATIVEYASMTCGHCAHFHNKVFPELKSKYIDTGKVRFIMREFPLDNLAAAGAMLARCAGGEKTFPLIGVLFEKQEEWVVRNNPVPKLFEIAKQAGFTQESFDKCLTDQKLLDQLGAVRARASETFGVSSTPTFFVNGKRLVGASTLADFDKALEPILKG